MPFFPLVKFGQALDRRAHLRRKAKALYDAALKHRYKPNNKSIEIIGLPSAVFTHITTDSVPGSLTQTTFDTTSRADSAQILLTNSTGGSKIITAAWIRGKPVTRLSDGNRSRASGSPMSIGGKGGAIAGGGYLHDKFVDYERIAQDGEMTFETGNNFVVTAAQVNQLADYYWKLNRTKKHIYSLSLVGFQSWFEPGEWYTLQIGGAGEEEYIDSTVECFDVRCSLAADSAPYTSVSFREVEENWKFDSNDVARQIAAGGADRRTSHDVITIAPQYYSGYADYYCDGTDDQIEINSGIDSLQSGGVVHLLKGTFNVSSSITLASKITLSGEGGGTILNKSSASSFGVITATGSSLSFINEINVEGITLQAATSYNVGYGIKYSYVDTGTISNVLVKVPIGDSIYLTNCMNCSVRNNVVKNDSNIPVGDVTNIKNGIWYQPSAATSKNNIVDSNVVDGLYSDAANVYGISVADIVGYGSVLVTNNRVNNVNTIGGVGNALGYWIYGYGITVLNNICVGTKSDAAKEVGFYIATASTNCRMLNNYAYNNGDDTDIANTNYDNFFDAGTDTQWAG